MFGQLLAELPQRKNKLDTTTEASSHARAFVQDFLIKLRKLLVE